MNMEDAVLQLVSTLNQAEYRFICPTPETHQTLWNLRSGGSKQAISATDIFGWSLPCTKPNLQKYLGSDLVDRLVHHQVFVKHDEDTYKSSLRLSNMTTKRDSRLYIHSSFPTNQKDSVFFGPDTYRFLDYLYAKLPSLRPITSSAPLADVCCGAGAGSIALRDIFPHHPRVLGLDINPKALSLAKLNSKTANGSSPPEFILSSFFDAVKEERFSIITSNPPYIAGDLPTYAAGGDLGLELSLEIIRQAEEVLVQHGYLVLYTGVTILFDEPTRDILYDFIVQRNTKWDILSYDILDVDVFANELLNPGYEGAARIQVVGCVLEKR